MQCEQAEEFCKERLDAAKVDTSKQFAAKVWKALGSWGQLKRNMGRKHEHYRP